MIGFNLVPKNMRNKSRRMVNWLRIGTVFAIALTIFAVSMTVYNRVTIAVYQDELTGQQGSLASVQGFQRELTQLRNENRTVRTEVESVQALVGRDGADQVVRILSDLAANVPEGILLENIRYSRGAPIQVSGLSLSPADVSTFLSRIESLPGVRSAHLAVLQRPSDADELMRSFLLRIEWSIEGT